NEKGFPATPERRTAARPGFDDCNDRAAFVKNGTVEPSGTPKNGALSRAWFSNGFKAPNRKGLFVAEAKVAGLNPWKKSAWLMRPCLIAGLFRLRGEQRNSALNSACRTAGLRVLLSSGLLSVPPKADGFNAWRPSA